jgi:CBS domain-containing protein
MTPEQDPFIENLGHLKQTDPVQMDDSATYGEVLGVLQKKRIGSILLCHDGQVTGIFTERDILNKSVLENTPPDTPIKNLMTKKPITIECDKTIGDAIRLMHTKHIRNLPMVDKDGSLVGLLTVGRLIRFLASVFPAEVVNLPPQPNQITTEVEGA